MKSIEGVGLSEVQAVYGGAEGDLWELLMGQQIHMGGFKSSMDLSERAGIGAAIAGAPKQPFSTLTYGGVPSHEARSRSE